jgi:hypothetical protein
VQGNDKDAKERVYLSILRLVHPLKGLFRPTLEAGMTEERRLWTTSSKYRVFVI